ncbi:MAG: hypothetical protein ABIN97_13940 [Ginsengibacter sp.]
MNETSIKKALHKTIEETDNEELLQAVYTILIATREGKNGFDLTEAELQLLKEREEGYLSGKSKTYTWEEVKSRLKT